MIDKILELSSKLISENQYLLISISIFSLFTFFLSIISIPFLVSKIPEDYFLKKKRKILSTFSAHPIIRILLIIIKNFIAIIIIILGVIMLFIPGQGILTIFVGLIFLDFPGKYCLEKKIIANNYLFNLINKLRKNKNAKEIKR